LPPSLEPLACMGWWRSPKKWRSHIVALRWVMGGRAVSRRMDVCERLERRIEVRRGKEGYLVHDGGDGAADLRKAGNTTGSTSADP